jgi:putative ABC transport system permease protein
MKKTFIKKGLREIWAHKVQYFLLALVIGLGVAAYSSFNDFARYRKDGLDQIFEESNFMDLQVTMNYGSTLNSTTIEEIMQENGHASSIESWEMRLVYEVFIEHEHENELKVTRGQVMGQFVSEGSSPDELTVNTPLFYVDDPENYDGDGINQCYIERKFSEFYGFKSGSNININRGNASKDLTVKEQVAVPEYFFVIREGDFAPSERSYGIMLVTIETAMDLYSGDDWNETVVNEVVLRVDDDTDLEALESELQNSFESRGVAVKFTEKEENPSRYFLISDYENDKNSQAVMPVIIFAVSAFGLVMALRRMIRSHRPQIGIFKALGMKNRTIMIYFSIIAVFIAVVGTILGYLLSIPLNMSFQNLGEQLLDFPVDQYNVTYIYYFYGALISIGLCLSCTLIPALLAVRVKPIDVIQGKEGVSKKQVGRLGGVLGRTRWLPVSLKLTIRNQLRKPFKSLSTIIGVAMSLSLFLGFMMVMESALDALDSTSEGMDWDYEISMEGFQPDIVSESWEGEFEDIRTKENGIMLPTTIEPDDSEYEALIYSIGDLENMFDIELERGSLRDGMVVISWYHADKMGLKPGDRIEMELPILDPAVGFKMDSRSVTICGVHSNHLGSVAFMDLDSLQKYTGLDGMINTVYLQTTDGDKIRTMENELITKDGVSSVSHITDREGLIDQYLDIFIGVVAVMAIISVILAGAIIYTMFRISAREQERDYATMKTLGTTLAKIRKLIFQEGAYITVLGIGLGILGAYGMAYYMLNQSAEWESFGMTTQFSWAGFVSGSLLIIFTVVLVSFLTMRYIAKINIANVIRERAAG